MSQGIQNLIDRTRVLAGLAKTRGMNDRQLLDRFADGDEAAFTAIVDRYGGLVMGVCRRILQHTQDAEDAFQATFMVLARKAGKIGWHDSVANWLHSVAYRVSCQVRRETSRLRITDLANHEPEARETDPTLSEIKPVLDEELNRLPARYRIPLILCCLEGKTRDEAAAQLGWSVGSVKGRLERGRELLKSRLAKRGLALAAVLGTILLSGTGASAAVPVALGLATVRAGMTLLTGQSVGVVSTHVLTLTQGVLNAMFLTKLKIAAAVLFAVGTLGVGTTYVAVAKPHPEPAIGGGYALQREQRQAAPTVNGIVREIDAKAGSIKVLISRTDSDGQTFELSKSVKVTIREGRDAKEAKLDDVKERTRVVLTLNAEKVVQAIDILATVDGGERSRSDGRTVSGAIGDVDTAKSKLTLLTGGGRGNDPTRTTYDVSKDAKITTREGREIKPLKLDDLKPKMNVTLRLDADKKVIESIDVIVPGPRGAGEERRVETPGIHGILSEVDAAKNTIMLTTGGRNEPAQETTYQLAKDCKVIFRTGRLVAEKKLADLELKKPVHLRLDDAKKLVTAIEVTISTQVGGAVTEITATTITIDTAGGRGEPKTETYELGKDVKVYYRLGGFAGRGGERGAGPESLPMTIADVTEKTRVTLQLDDERKVVQSIDLALQTMHGSVQSIDAKKLTILLRPLRGDDANFDIAKDARVMVNGKAGKLDEVAVGADVMVTLSPDRAKVLILQTPPGGR